MWEVEKIESDRTDYERGGIEYYTKWKGYPRSSNTWEPPSSFEMCKQILEEYTLRKASVLAEREARRREAAAAAAIRFHRMREHGPSDADGITALAKQYQEAGLNYWRAYEKATVDYMAKATSK